MENTMQQIIAALYTAWDLADPDEGADPQIRGVIQAAINIAEGK